MGYYNNYVVGWTAAAVGALLPIAIAIYRLTLHPLARVPGPKMAAVTGLWQAGHARDGRMRELAKTLHKKYGVVVRVGPNEVWINSKESKEIIYAAGTPFEKANWYWIPKFHPWTVDWKLNRHASDCLDFFTETNKELYRQQRRSIGPVYSIANLKRYEKPVDEILDRLVAKLRALGDENGDRLLDLAEWMHILAFECLSSLTLSWSPGQIEEGTGQGGVEHGYSSWRMWSALGLLDPVVVAGAIFSPLKTVFVVLAGVVPSTPPGFKDHWPALMQMTEAYTSKDGPGKRRPEGDITDDLSGVRAKKPEFSTKYQRGMMIQNFGAGRDTLTAVMTAALALSCSDAEVRRKIQEELAASEHPTRFDDAKDLEYTQACLKESQRLYPVVAMSLMRRVPPSGLTLHGHYFPPGTTVGCNPSAYHLNEAVFGENADVFDPNRWLGNLERRRSLELAALTWGGSNRRCPGQHLARLVCYKAFTRLMNEFDIEVVVPEDSEMPFYFVAMMTGVKARFRPRS